MVRIRATASAGTSTAASGGGDRKRRRAHTSRAKVEAAADEGGSGTSGKKPKKGRKKKGPPAGDTVETAAELPEEHAALLRDYNQLDAVCCLLIKRKLRCSLSLIYSMVSLATHHTPPHPTTA